MNTAGTTSRLSAVEVISPPSTVIPIGETKEVSLDAEPMMAGSMPAPMAIVVMMIGRARLWQASASACQRSMPCSRRATMAYSTSRMEFFVTIPISITSPISTGSDMS